MPLDLTNIVKIYQNNIDDLINQLGKIVVICFEDTVSSVTDTFYDPVRGDELKQPGSKEMDISQNPSITTNSKTIKALHKYSPKEWNQVAPHINEPSSILRLKTFLDDVPSLLRCKYIIPNSQSQNILYTKFRLIKEPIPVGLQQDRYAVSYWERI